MHQSSQTTQPDNNTLFAYLLIILLGGSNSVAIRFSNQELAPFWGAFLRFAGATVIYWAILVVRRMKLPSLRDSLILAIVGFLGTGVSFALLYWALQSVPVGFATVVISTSPLFTLAFAVLHRIEKFRIQSLVGGLIAIGGLILAVNAQPGGTNLLPAILALVFGSLVAAEGNVILKMYSLQSDPVIINALSFTAGAIFLGAASIAAGEAHHLPVTVPARTAVVYLILIGSVIMFNLYIHVLTRWSASATASVVLFFPLVATVLAALLANEPVTLPFVVGGGSG
jgi:drug/metabolite transporter (DMT)-like permease